MTLFIISIVYLCVCGLLINPYIRLNKDRLEQIQSNILTLAYLAYVLSIPTATAYIYYFLLTSLV